MCVDENQMCTNSIALEVVTWTRRIAGKLPILEDDSPSNWSQTFLEMLKMMHDTNRISYLRKAMVMTGILLGLNGIRGKAQFYDKI